MISLNRYIYSGMEVSVPNYLSWQTAEAKIGGAYHVSEIIDHDFYYGTVLLRRDSDGLILEAAPRVVAYLAGKHVPNIKPFVEIDPELFQPEILEMEYHTEGGGKFGFWYCGSHGDHKVLDSTLITESWCYGTMPWDK